MEFCIYTRDSSGLITYHGPSHGWSSEQDCVAHYGSLDRINPMPAPYTENIMGWAHNKVRWYDDVGVGIDDAALPAVE